MRRPGFLVLALLLVAVVVLARDIRRAGPPPSPYCRGGPPLAGVYHASRLHVRSRCRVASGIVERVKFEDYDGDVHFDLRLDDGYEHLLSRGNREVGGDLVAEIIPQDRARVAIPEQGSRVTIVGPWVDDEQHGWREIHPVWWVSAGRIQPATDSELARARTLLLRGGSDGG
jgi:hypothetical protein